MVDPLVQALAGIVRSATGFWTLLRDHGLFFDAPDWWPEDWEERLVEQEAAA